MELKNRKHKKPTVLRPDGSDKISSCVLHDMSVVHNLHNVKAETILIMKQNQSGRTLAPTYQESVVSSTLQMVEQVRVIRGLALHIELNSLFPSFNKINLLKDSQMSIFGLADLLGLGTILLSSRS